MLAALLGTSLATASPAAADSGELVPITQVLTLPELRLTTSESQDPLLPYKSCAISVRATFNGVQNTSTGQITGDWEQIAGTYCEGNPNGNMELLTIGGFRAQNGVVQARMATAICESDKIDPG